MDIDLSTMEVVSLEDWPVRPRRRPVARHVVAVDSPNCDERFPPSSAQTLYCSDRCRDQAKFVRTGRKLRRQYGDRIPPAQQADLHKQRAFAVGAGYDASKRRLSDDVKRAVWLRAGDRCESCGQPGAEVDHKDGPSPALDNLQLLCVPCHDRKTALRYRVINSPDLERDRRVLLRRVEAAMPERPCDAEDWDAAWRDWHREHAVRA